MLYITRLRLLWSPQTCGKLADNHLPSPFWSNVLGTLSDGALYHQMLFVYLHCMTRAVAGEKKDGIVQLLLFFAINRSNQASNGNSQLAGAGALVIQHVVTQAAMVQLA